ncbi:hypothetical protein BOVAB4_1355 [Bacteroides ovatus]|nr:hypothetical protein BOVA115_1617 [Bacteroides ovatus]CAG9908824.1 hypothetical protein BOVAB4_1355 [Bacteroides ovatus]
MCGHTQLKKTQVQAGMIQRHKSIAFEHIAPYRIVRFI